VTATTAKTNRPDEFDLITFFPPARWQISSPQELEALGIEQPRRVWNTMLDPVGQLVKRRKFLDGATSGILKKQSIKSDKCTAYKKENIT
jgi:hypothetical protein